MKEHILNLLTEAKIESEYNRYKDLLDYETYEKIVTKDPDYRNGYLGKFGHWLVKIYLALPSKDAKKRFIEEDLTKEQTQDSMKLFLRFKSQITNREDKELTKIKSLGELYDIILKYGLDAKLSKSDKKKEVEKGEFEADLLYEDDDWKVVSPKTPESAKFYGKGTSWCTAGSSQGEYYFNKYTEDGPLYIILNKDDDREKYQLHFPSAQYMDRYDDPISLSTYLDGMNSDWTSGLINYVSDLIYGSFFEKHGDVFTEEFEVIGWITCIGFDKKKGTIDIKIPPRGYDTGFEYGENYYGEDVCQDRGNEEEEYFIQLSSSGFIRCLEGKGEDIALDALTEYDIDTEDIIKKGFVLRDLETMLREVFIDNQNREKLTSICYDIIGDDLNKYKDIEEALINERARLREVRELIGEVYSVDIVQGGIKNLRVPVDEMLEEYFSRVWGTLDEQKNLILKNKSLIDFLLALKRDNYYAIFWSLYYSEEDMPYGEPVFDVCFNIVPLLKQFKPESSGEFNRLLSKEIDNFKY